MSRKNASVARDLKLSHARILRAYSGQKTDDQRRVILETANAVYEEWNEVIGQDQDASYAMLTNELRNAEGKLKQIRNERDQMANALIDAGSLVAAVNKVLALFP